MSYVEAKFLPQTSENITCTGSVFATLKPCTKLTNRHQKIDVIAANKILRQSNYRGHQ